MDKGSECSGGSPPPPSTEDAVREKKLSFSILNILQHAKKSCNNNLSQKGTYPALEQCTVRQSDRKEALIESDDDQRLGTSGTHRSNPEVRMRKKLQEKSKTAMRTPSQRASKRAPT